MHTNCQTEKRFALGPWVVCRAGLLCGATLSTLQILLAVAAVSLAACAGAQTVSLPSPEEIFKILSTMDSTIGANLTVVGTALRLPTRFSPGLEAYPIEVTFTQQQKKAAYRAFVPEFPKMPPPTDTGQINPMVSNWVYKGPETGGSSYLSLRSDASRAELGPTPEFWKQRDDYFHASITLSFRKEIDRKVVFDEIEHALGRGFTRYATRCLQVESAPEGLLRVTLDSPILHQFLSGRWELLVDPSAGYLARGAKYYPEDRDTPTYVLHTEGLLETEDGFFVARSADVEDYEDHYIGPNTYYFTEAVLAADESLFEECRHHLSMDAFPNLFVSFTDLGEDGQQGSVTYLKEANGVPKLSNKAGSRGLRGFAAVKALLRDLFEHGLFGDN